MKHNNCVYYLHTNFYAALETLTNKLTNGLYYHSQLPRGSDQDC